MSGQVAKSLFAQFRVSEVIVSDNGSCFVSEEFEYFLYTNAWHQAHHVCIISPNLKWPHRKGCADHKEWAEEGERRNSSVSSG